MLWSVLTVLNILNTVGSFIYFLNFAGFFVSTEIATNTLQTFMGTMKTGKNTGILPSTGTDSILTLKNILTKS